MNKTLVRIMCIVLGILMVASSVVIIASGLVNSCAA